MAKRSAAPTSGEVCNVLIRLNREGWRELKILAANEARTLQSLMVEASNDLLRKYGRRPLAKGPTD